MIFQRVRVKFLDSNKKSTFYTGDMLNGEIMDMEKMKLTNGDVFEGNFINGLYHGYGKLSYGNKTFEGYWKNGLKDGKGTILNVDNTKYLGTWESGKSVGKVRGHN